jgi:hypothetical protein
MPRLREQAVHGLLAGFGGQQRGVLAQQAGGDVVADAEVEVE